GSLIEWPTPERLLLLPIGGGAALLAALGRRLKIRVPHRARQVIAGVVTVGVALAIVIGGDKTAGRRHAYTIGDDDLAAGWAWVAAHAPYSQVAYTGTNLAFPLRGRYLLNRVAYVNVAGRPDDRLHDFGPPGDGTPEPAPYRRGASADVWLGNLRAAH